MDEDHLRDILKVARMRFMSTDIVLHDSINGNVISFIPHYEAFVMMCHTIPSMLEKHMVEVNGFNEWWFPRWEELKKTEIFKFFHVLRNDFIHHNAFLSPENFTYASEEYKRLGIVSYLIQINPKFNEMPQIVLTDNDLLRSRLENYEKSHQRYIFKENRNMDAVYLACFWLQETKRFLDECVNKFTPWKDIHYLHN